MNGADPRLRIERAARRRTFRRHSERGESRVKPLGEMTTEELTEALEVLDDTGSQDTALRLALYLELRRAAVEEWLFDEENLSEVG